MKQPVEIQESSELAIKRQISDKFIQAMDEMIALGIVKNPREFAARIYERQEEISRIKKTDGKRYVDIDMMFHAVNELGMNANHWLVKGGDKTEPLQRKGVKIKGGTVNGNHNVVLTGQAVSNSGDVYFNVEKLIQSLPGKDKKAILEKIGSLEAQTVGMNNVIEDLKKTIDRYERELESRDKHIRALEKLNSLLEQPKSKKK